MLDFRKVQVLSSAVLGRLILLQKHAASTGGRTILCGIAKEVFEVFTIAKLEKLLTIKEGAEAALGTFGIHAETRGYALDE